jgi:U3 small nucleolar RNA-associated protein 20
LIIYDPVTFPTKKSDHFLLLLDGSLYKIAHNLCLQLDSDEEDQRDELTATIVKLLTWIVQAMKSMPHLCFTTKDHAESRDPVNWLMTRLANIAKQKGNKRRRGVYKCFAAFATYCGKIAFDYLELMLEPLHRTELEAWHSSANQMGAVNSISNSDAMTDEAQFAKEVLFLLEEKCESHERFLNAYAAVKAKAHEKKTKRKNEMKTEAVIDPISAAKRRIGKQEHEKQRRKRRVEDKRQVRSVRPKGKHIS